MAWLVGEGWRRQVSGLRAGSPSERDTSQLPMMTRQLQSAKERARDRDREAETETGRREEGNAVTSDGGDRSVSVSRWGEVG